MIKKSVLILFMWLIFGCAGCLVIYLATYNLENKALFNGVMSVFSAIFGGALTLTGFAWTIFTNVQIQKKQEMIQYRPYLKLVDESDCGKTKIIKLNKDNTTNNQKAVKILPFCIKNISNAFFVLEGVFVDNMFFSTSDYIVGNNEYITIIISEDMIDIDKNIAYIKITGKDLLENTYSYDCQAVVNHDDNLNIDTYQITNVSLHKKC